MKERFELQASKCGELKFDEFLRSKLPSRYRTDASTNFDLVGC